MDTKQALEILVQSVALANKRGAFELGESKIIAEAVEVFTKKPNGTNTDTAGDTSTATNGETEEEVRVEGEESPKKG